MGAGFLVRKFRVLTEKSIGELVNFLLIIVNPCLIIYAFNRPYDPSMMRGFEIAFVFAMVMHLILIALVAFSFRWGSPARDVVLKTAAAFSNAGFIGIPLEQAILGTAGVFYGAAYIAVFNIFMWSWGLGINRNGRFTVSRQMILNPGMIAVIVGAVVFFLPWDLPVVIGKPVEMLAAMNTPIAMAVIGYYLAGAKFKAVLKVPAAHFAFFIRLVISPLIAIALLWLLKDLLDLDRTMMLAVVIPASAPAAAMVSMFAAKYNRDVDMSVALVSGTTLFSLLTMPLLVALAMHVL